VENAIVDRGSTYLIATTKHKNCSKNNFFIGTFFFAVPVFSTFPISRLLKNSRLKKFLALKKYFRIMTKMPSLQATARSAANQSDMIKPLGCRVACGSSQ